MSPTAMLKVAVGGSDRYQQELFPMGIRAGRRLRLLVEPISGDLHRPS
jgi:hypothetical protein